MHAFRVGRFLAIAVLGACLLFASAAAAQADEQVQYPFFYSGDDSFSLRNGPPFLEDDDDSVWIYAHVGRTEGPRTPLVMEQDLTSGYEELLLDASYASVTVDGVPRAAGVTFETDDYGDDRCVYSIPLTQEDFSVGEHRVTVTYAAPKAPNAWGDTSDSAADSDSQTLVYTVKGKPSYKLSLSRGVSDGKAYVYVTVRSWDGKVVSGKTVKLHKGSKYIGKAKTNSKGRAKFRVSKHYASAKYKATVKGTGTYKATSKTKKLAFVETSWWWTDSFYSNSDHLKAGRYKLRLYTNSGEVKVRARGLSADLDTLHKTRTFTLRSGRTIVVTMWNYYPYGTTRMKVIRYM